MSAERPGLRERTRRAVQQEIGEAAVALFMEHGYEATTIDDIAAAVGLSQRSVFRYFGTKDDIVIGKLDLAEQQMLAALRARPADEPVWESLNGLVHMLDAPNDPRAEAIHRVVIETPTLLGAYLQKLQQIQEAVVTVLYERATASGTPYEVDDPTPRALTAAAFGGLVAAQRSWIASGARGSLGAAIDRALSVIAPCPDATTRHQSSAQEPTVA